MNDMCQKEITVSVVMATYNGEKFISEQLESILGQSSKVDEIIIVDDVSRDDTQKVLEQYQGKYTGLIKYYVNEKNKGYARNFWDAIKKAKGDIIFLSDQDDVWEKDKVETVKEIFINNEKILTLNTAYKLIDSFGNDIHDYKNIHFKNNKKLKKISFKHFVKSPRYPGMAMAFRKNLLLELVDIDEKLITAHDWMLNQCAAKNEGMFFWDKVTTHYRQHGNNTYGMNSLLDKTKLFLARVKVIEDEIRNFTSLSVLYGNDELFIRKMKQVAQKRLEYFKGKKILKILLYYLLHMRYIALRGGLGDVYIALKCKKV